MRSLASRRCVADMSEYVCRVSGKLLWTIPKTGTIAELLGTSSISQGPHGSVMLSAEEVQILATLPH